MRAYVQRLTPVPTTVITAVSMRVELNNEAAARPAGVATANATTRATAHALQS
jgi:hypothetical protein